MLGNFTSKVQPHSSRDFTAGVGVLLVYFLVVLYHTTAVGLTTVYYITLLGICKACSVTSNSSQDL